MLGYLLSVILSIFIGGLARRIFNMDRSWDDMPIGICFMPVINILVILMMIVSSLFELFVAILARLYDMHREQIDNVVDKIEKIINNWFYNKK